MKPEKPSALLSRCTAPLIFDNDLFWDGCSDDAAFFARNRRRMFRLRNAFSPASGVNSETSIEACSSFVFRRAGSDSASVCPM